MTTEFRLYLVTWNVGESNPPEDFNHLLGLDQGQLPDLYAIGLQELKSDTTTLISDSIFDDPWTNAISSALCQRGYVRVKSLRLVGIHLSLYVKRSQLLDISSIESEFTRTGFAGLWGSKGGVSIRMDVHGVNLCFVNSHFSAHQENYAQRIEDYNQVLLSQKFRDPDCPNILDNDYVFWLGDLNFRLNELSNEEVRQKVVEEKYAELLGYDQLNEARSKSLIFLNFEEGDISFPPTFKFDLETDNYDTSSKCRTPAWCDRILWRVHEDAFSGTSLSVQQHSYKSLQGYKNSDHKPVVSSFTIKVLKDSPCQPVMFEPLSCWSRGKEQKVTYSISKVFPTSSRDWIGLYPVNFKNFEEYSTYNWVPQRGEDNDDGTFLCSVVFEERDLRRLSSGRYKLLYFSAVHNHAVGYSDDLELLEPDRATSSEDEQVLPGEAGVDHPSRVTPDAQPSGLRAAKHPLDPAPSEVDSKEKSMKKVEEVARKERIEPGKVEKLYAEDGKVSCKVEKAEEAKLPAEGDNFLPAVENLSVEVEKLPTKDEEIEKLTTEIKQLSSEIQQLDAEVGDVSSEVEKQPLEIEQLPSERKSVDVPTVEVEKLPEEAEKEEPQENLPLSSEPEFEKCEALATRVIETPPIKVPETDEPVIETTSVKVVCHDAEEAAGEEHRQDQKEDQEVDESSKQPQAVKEVDSAESCRTGTPSVDQVVMGAEKPSVVVEEKLVDDPASASQGSDVQKDSASLAPHPNDDGQLMVKEMTNPDAPPEDVKTCRDDFMDRFGPTMLTYQQFQKEVASAPSSGIVKDFITRLCDFDLPELLEPLPPPREATRGERESLESGNGTRNESEPNNPAVSEETLEGNETSLEFLNWTPEKQKDEDSNPIDDVSFLTEENLMKSEGKEFERMVRLANIQKEHDYSKRRELSVLEESLHQVEAVATQVAGAVDVAAEIEQHRKADDTQEKKVLDELSPAVQERPLDGENSTITLLQQEQQKRTTPSDSEALESPKKESSRDAENVSQDEPGHGQVSFEIVEKVVLAENTSVQAAFKPEEGSLSPEEDSKKESLKEFDIEKEEESESQTQSSSSDFEVIQFPTKHSTLESFEDGYLSMREEALADKDSLDGVGKETAEKVSVQSALQSSESEPKDPELIESINAQLLEQNMSGFVESLGDFGADDFPFAADAANVKLEHATKSSADGEADDESKEEEKCVVVKEGVVYEGDDSSGKTKSDPQTAEVKVVKESQLSVEHTSEVSEKKVVEFVDNVVATAVQEAVTSCLSLEDEPQKQELKETFESQDDKKAESTESDETALRHASPKLSEGREAVLPHSDLSSHPRVEEEKVETSVQQQQQQQQEQSQQVQEHLKEVEGEISHETPAAEACIRHQREPEQQPQQELQQAQQTSLPPHVKHELSTIPPAAPLSSSDLKTHEKHLDAPSEVSTDDLSHSTHIQLQPSDDQNGSSNFFNAYMDLREKSLADKELDGKSEKEKVDSMPSTPIAREALKVVDGDLIEKNLSDLSKDMGLEMDNPKEEAKQQEEDGKYEAKKEAELLIGDEFKTESHSTGDSQRPDVSSESPEVVKEAKDAANPVRESLVKDTSQLLQASEMPAEGDRSTGKEVQPTGTTIFQAPAEDPSLEKTELYQTKPSEVREEIHEATNH